MTGSASRVRVLAAAVLAAIAGVLPAFLAGGVAVQIRHDLGIGDAAFGMAIATFFFAAALASGPFGRLTERLGASTSLRVATVANAVVLAAIAAGVRQWGVLLVLLAAGGSVNGLTQPAANLTLARAMPERRKGLAFGVKQSAVPASTLLAGLAVPALALTVGWRWAFASGAVLAVLAFPVIPSQARMGSGPEHSEEQPAFGGNGNASKATLRWLAVGIGLGATAANALGSFLVSSGVRAGLGNAAAGLLLTIGSVAGLSTRLGMGALADRRDGGHLRWVGVMLAIGTIGFGLLATGSRWGQLAGAPIAFAAGWGWPGLFNLAVVRASPAAPGAATGVTQTGTYIGAGAGPLLFGLLAERWSYAVGWAACAALALLGAAVLRFAAGRLRREGLPA